MNDLSKLPCGVFHCPLQDAYGILPEFSDAFDSCPNADGILDVKVHMLMPGQYPCIPNWHYDFDPRDKYGRRVMEQRDSDHKMWVLLSGPPWTEWEDGRVMKPWEWSEFTQFDKHRGRPSQEHCWRVFMRVVPSSICDPAPRELWVRRHCQVYLDAGSFEW